MRTRAPSASEARTAAGVFRALADPHRLKIFATVAASSRPVCVCDLGLGLPLLQPTVSHHLKVLKAAGLVASERCGTWVYYRVAGGALKRLTGHIALTTQRRWNHENTPVAADAASRRQRHLLPASARGRSG